MLHDYILSTTWYYFDLFSRSCRFCSACLFFFFSKKKPENDFPFVRGGWEMCKRESFFNVADLTKNKSKEKGNWGLA